MPARLSMNPNTIMKSDLESQIRISGELGYEGFEVMYQPVADYLAAGHKVEDVKQLLGQAGLQVSTLSMESCDWQCQSDPAEQERQWERARTCCKWTKTLGCNRITACSALGEVPIDAAAKSLKKLCDIAAKHGVTVLYEPLGFGKNLATPRAAMEQIKACGASNVGYLADSFHWLRAGGTLEELREVCSEGRLQNVHINDVMDVPIAEMTDLHRVYPGDGVMPLSDFLGVVKEVGYSGWFSIEIFNEAYWKQDPVKVARQALKTSREALAELWP